MIKFISDPFSGKIEKVALPGHPDSYAALCKKMDWPLESTLIFDQSEQVTDKALPIKNPQALTVALVPEGGDTDTVGVITGVALIGIGAFTGQPGFVYQGLLTLAGTAYAREQRKKTEAIRDPGQDDFNAIAARLNKNQYGQPMPIFIGRGRFSPDMSAPPYQRMEGAWQDPRQITYATYTFGDSAGVTFGDFKSGDIRLEGTDGVVIKTGADVPQDSLVDTGEGAQLSAPTKESNEPVATYNTKALATRVELDITYAAGLTTAKSNVKQNSVPFTLETKTEGGEWALVEFSRLMWSSGLGSGGGLNRSTSNPEALALISAFAGAMRGSAYDGIRSKDKYLIRAYGHDGTPHRGTMAFDIPSNAAATAVRLTFKVPALSSKHHYTAELSVEQFRSYYPDGGDYSGQQRVQVRYASDGPWSRQLPPMTAHYQATVEGFATSNPADWFRHFLAAARFPDNMIDHASIAEWRTYCANALLEYNRVLRGDIKIADLLISLCQVGHAKIAPIRGKLGVILFNDDTVVREFSLDHQRKDPPMTVSVAQKPKIKGLEIAFIDMHEMELVPLNIGSAPYERVQIPGITLKPQAARELKLAWDEMQVNHPIVSFAADDSALDLYRGQRIKVHGQAGVFSGTKICRVLSVTPNENTVTITARLELSVVNNDNVQSILLAKPVPRGGISRAADVKLQTHIEGGKFYLKITWRNVRCDGQTVHIINETGQTFVIQGAVNRITHEVPPVNQLYQVELSPSFLGVRNSPERSLGANTQRASIYVDTDQLRDIYAPDHPKVRGLRLIHTDKRAAYSSFEFSGSDCSIGWQRIKTYSHYRVRIYDQNSGKLLRATDAADNRYRYSLTKNRGDTAALDLPQNATRHLRFSVAGVNADKTTGRVGSITVFNRLPSAPHLAIYIAAPGYIEVKITTPPSDPDFMGYLVWLDDTADFTPSGNSVDAGNCIKTLDHLSSSFSVHVPPGVTQYIKAAGFDAFTDNPQVLNVSASIELTGVELLDFAEIESKLNTGWNSLTINDGGALVDSDGNPVYDLGDATPEQRERWQQFIAASLRGITAPYQGWHADLIDGAVVKAGSLHADKIETGTLTAEHLNANTSYSAFLSSHEMDVHNIYYGRYEYGADGRPLLDANKLPVLTPGGGQRLFDYIEGKISAPLGQFQHLEVEIGGLVQTFRKGYGPSKRNLTSGLHAGNAAGSGYEVLRGTSVNITYGYLEMNRRVEIRGVNNGITKTIDSQALTGTVLADSRVRLALTTPHDTTQNHNWRINFRQVLYISYDGGAKQVTQMGQRFDAYGAEANTAFHGFDATNYKRLYREVQLYDSFNLGYSDVVDLKMGISVIGMEAWPAETPAEKIAAVKGLARFVRFYSASSSAVCVLNLHKNS